MNFVISQFFWAIIILVTSLHLFRALEWLASQSKAPMRSSSLITRKQQKLNSASSWRNPFNVKIKGAFEKVWHESRGLWEQQHSLYSLLTDTKGQLIDLQVSLENYCKVLALFGFNYPDFDFVLRTLVCYPFLLMEEFSKLPPSRKESSLSCSNTKTLIFGI